MINSTGEIEIKDRRYLKKINAIENWRTSSLEQSTESQAEKINRRKNTQKGNRRGWCKQEDDENKEGSRCSWETTGNHFDTCPSAKEDSGIRVRKLWFWNQFCHYPSDLRQVTWDNWFMNLIEKKNVWPAHWSPRSFLVLKCFHSLSIGTCSCRDASFVLT